MSRVDRTKYAVDILEHVFSGMRAEDVSGAIVVRNRASEHAIATAVTAEVGVSGRRKPTPGGPIASQVRRNH